MSPRRWMFRSLLAAACLSGGGCGDFWPGKPKPAVVPADSSKAGFMSLYTTNCAACHGAEGVSGAARPLNDPLYLSIIPKSAFLNAVGHGQGILMPAYLTSEGGPMDEKELATFVDDVYTYWGAKEEKSSDTLPAYANSSGSAGQGAKAFATWCGACHGQDGSGLGEKKPVDGAVNGHSVVDKFYLRLISDQGLRSAVIFGHPKFGMPSYRGPFPGKGNSALDESAINDIVAWLISQRLTVKKQAQEMHP